MKETLAIFDRDVRYADSLCRKLNGAADFPYTAVRFRTREELLNFTGSGRIALLLLDRTAEDEEIRRVEAGRTFYLTDVCGYPWVDNVPTVYKYQPVHQIEEILRKQSPVPAGGYGITETPLFRTKYIGVVSPVGRCMKTSFALTLGQILAQRSRLLYMNFELCAGFETLFDQTFDTTLSDVLYAYETHRESCEMKPFIRSFHGMDFIAPAAVPEDLYRADPQQVRRLVTELGKDGAYDLVLLDMGTDLRIAESLLGLCGTVYVPTRDDVLSAEKVRLFKEWMVRKEGDKILSRVKEPVLPATQPFTGGKMYLEQLLFGEIGGYVRNMLKNMGMD